MRRLRRAAPFLLLGLLLVTGLVLHEPTAAQVTLQGKAIWSCGLDGLDATLTECQAAAAAGTRYYITDVVVQTTTTTSGTYAVISGTGTDCATASAAVFPPTDTADRYNAPITTEGAASYHFVTPIPVTVAHAVCVIGVATNTITIRLGGYRGQ